MKTRRQTVDSLWLLLADLLSAQAQVWVARLGRDADLTPEAHIYFFDWYRRLAECHRARGRLARAKRYDRKADEHFRAGGGDGPPYAAAMAMPRPRQFIRTHAVSGRDARGGDDVA